MKNTAQFEVGTTMETTNMTVEVVKKTKHFTTLEVTHTLLPTPQTFQFRRKEQFDMKDAGWLDPAIPTQMVDWKGTKFYACDFE